jgi:hypothetical protein
MENSNYDEHPHLWFYIKIAKVVDNEIVEDSFFKLCEECKTMYQIEEEEYIDSVVFFVDELDFSNN